jgi:hypothetical protein
VAEYEELQENYAVVVISEGNTGKYLKKTSISSSYWFGSTTEKVAQKMATGDLSLYYNTKGR